MDSIRLADFREAVWLLGHTNPTHHWKRRSGNPARQLERNGFDPPEDLRDRGFRSLTDQGKALYRKWATREGLPLPETAPRQSIAERYTRPTAPLRNRDFREETGSSRY